MTSWMLHVCLLYFFWLAPDARLPGDLPEARLIDAPPAAQERPLARRLHRLRSPSIGFPAVAASGENFAIWSERGLEKAVLLPADDCGAPVILALEASEFRLDGRFRRTVARIPAEAPRGVWHLEITWDDGTRHVEPQAVRTLGPVPESRDFRLAVMTDHQLLDPSWELGDTALAPESRPRYGESMANAAMTQQIFHELQLLDPDLVVHLGDLLFGLDYTAEYESMLSRIRRSRVASFYIPGNHDAYATYSLRLPDLGSVALNLVACRSRMPKDLDFKASWTEIWGFLSCLYSGLKDELFDHLVSDGLEHWKALLGPVNTAFVHGRFHFILLNTYGGTSRRRHSFSVYIHAFRRFIGAPMVDNYGGTLSEADLAFVEAELRAAAAAGRTPVVFGHHDPRGNMHQTPYHRNEPFPTDPVGINHFEEWNYDDDWDSDPSDARGRETAFENSGVRLLRLLARTGGYYISGHLHKDGQWTYAPGERIGRDVVAEKKLTFIKVTTAAASTKDGSRWGYRLFTARADGTLDLAETVPGRKSVPAGNFWVQTGIVNGRGELHAFNALPVPVEARVTLCVPPLPSGYRFTDGAGRRLELVHADFPAQTFSRFTYRLLLPPGKRPFSEPTRLDAVLDQARDNRPPELAWNVDGKRRVLQEGEIVMARKLDASPSRDPDGDALAQAHFAARGRVVSGFVWQGEAQNVVFAVRDDAGAWSRMTLSVSSPSPKPRTRPANAHGCGCACRDAAATVPVASLILLLGLLAFFRRRLWRKKKDG